MQGRPNETKFAMPRAPKLGTVHPLLGEKDVFGNPSGRLTLGGRTLQKGSRIAVFNSGTMRTGTLMPHGSGSGAGFWRFVGDRDAFEIGLIPGDGSLWASVIEQEAWT